LLGGGDGADFSSAAGVDGREFGGYDVGRWWGSIGWRFRGEKTRYEGFLEAGCCCVGDGAWEVGVVQLLPDRAGHCCRRELLMMEAFEGKGPG
jgi:hypothetical protein